MFGRDSSVIVRHACITLYYFPNQTIEWRRFVIYDSQYNKFVEIRASRRNGHLSINFGRSVSLLYLLLPFSVRPMNKYICRVFGPQTHGTSDHDHGMWNKKARLVFVFSAQSTILYFVLVFQPSCERNSSVSCR